MLSSGRSGQKAEGIRLETEVPHTILLTYLESHSIPTALIPHLFIHLINSPLLSTYYVTGILIRPGNMTVSKAEILCFFLLENQYVFKMFIFLI